MQLFRYALISTMVFFMSCEDDSNEVDNLRVVTYKVEGSSTASITLETDEGGVAQFANKHLPWTKTYQEFERGDFVYLSAQNDGNSGFVRVTILVDNLSWKSTISSGAYVIATATGSLE